MGHENRRPVLVFDSGVGGLPYLERIREILPGESFTYVADTAHFPYGEKSADELTEIVHRQMEKIIERIDPKLAVVACNTASVVALEELRAAFGIPFVGVVPAIKPAAEATKNGRIGLLATRKTVEDPYTDSLENEFASHCSLFRFAGVEIVDLVERRFFRTDAEQRRSILEPAINFFLARNVDQLILACTHFIFMEEELSSMLGGSVRLVDSREGVARQTKRILEGEARSAPEEQNGVQSAAGDGGMTVRSAKTDPDFHHTENEGFFVTGGGPGCVNNDSGIAGVTGEGQYPEFAEMFGLRWRGQL